MHPPNELLIINIPTRIILLLLLIISFSLFFKICYHLLTYLLLGQKEKENRINNILQRIGGIFTYVFFHKKVFYYRIPGIMHFFIFWGFIILFTVILEAILIGLGIDSFSFVKNTPLIIPIKFLLENLQLKLLQDIFTGLVLIGLFIAATIRYILRPKKFEGTNPLDASIILILIFIIMLSMLTMNACKILSGDKELAQFAFLSNIVAQMIYFKLSRETLFYLYNFSWWLHMIVILFFLVYIPSGKHLHLLAAVPNIFLRTFSKKGELIKIENIEEQEKFGVSKIEEFSWKHLLDLYACTECGRCQDNCPAYLTDKPLSPRAMIHDMREHLREVGKELVKKKEIEDRKKLIGDIMPEDAIFSCTTCRACQEMCPVLNEHINKMIEMRRNLVLMESKFPPEVTAVFKGMETQSNPWGIGAYKRAEWIEGLDIKRASEGEFEYLYYVGCAASFDDRNKKVAQAFAKILKNADVNFATLYEEEGCCGDSARRIGNEYLYQILVQSNIEVLNNYKVKKIITTCPHCYNTLKNEYYQFGGNYEVYHHTEFLYKLINEGKLKLEKELPKKIILHDSCYLGRYNEIYNEPRAIIKSVNGAKLLEFDRRLMQSFCCGAGGGRMWMEERLGKRINIERIEQALKKEPDYICTCCPFCLTMFTDGIKDKNLEEKIKVYDIIEIIS